MAGDRKLKLEILLKAIDAATRPFQGVEKQVDRTSAALAAHGKELQALKAQQRDIAAFRDQRRALGDQAIALRQAQTRVRALAQEHAEAENPTKKMTAALARARRELSDMTAAQRRRADGVRALRTGLEAAGVSTRNLATHERDLRRRIEETSRAVVDQEKKFGRLNERRRQLASANAKYENAQQLAGSMQGAGASSIAAGSALGAPLVLAAREAMGFEEAMADVRKVVDFPSPVAFKAMSDDILSLSTRLPVAKEELAGIMAQGARAGVARGDLLAYTEAAAKMGVAFDVTSEEAGAMMATWRTAFGMAQPEVIALADRVNALTNAYGGNAGAVSDMVTRVGPLGDVAGASGPHLAALAQVMNSVGVQSEIGATGIKNMLLGLTKGEAATKSQQKAFAALGLDASQMAKRMQTDASGAIMSVLSAVAELPKERGLAVLTQLFGSESVAAISPLLSQLELVRRNFRQVGDQAFYAGSMDKEFAARAATTTNAVNLAKNGVGALATEIGYSLLPQIKAFSAWAGTTAQGVRNFAAAHPGAIKVIVALLGALAIGLVVFGGVAIAIAAVLGPIALMRLSFVQALPVLRGVATGFMFVGRGAQWMSVALGGRVLTALKLARAAMIGFNLALLANPITWIIVGVVALAAAAFLIWKNWSKVGPWLSGVWDTIKGAVSAGLDAVVGFLMKWTIVGVIARNWDAVVDFFGATWSLIKEVVGLGLDSLKLAILTFTPLGFILRNWGPITTFFTNLWAGVKAVVSGAIEGLKVAFFNFTPLGMIIKNWGAITGFIGGVWETAKGLVSAGISAVSNAISNWGPLQAFQQAFASVFSWFSGLPARFLKFGTDIINGLTNGIRNRRTQVQEATAQATRSAATGVTRTAQIRSPSRLFAGFGAFMMDGLALGIRGQSGSAVDQMRRATVALAAAASLNLAPPEARAAEAAPRPEASRSVPAIADLRGGAPVPSPGLAPPEHHAGTPERQQSAASLFVGLPGHLQKVAAALSAVRAISLPDRDGAGRRANAATADISPILAMPDQLRRAAAALSAVSAVSLPAADHQALGPEPLRFETGSRLAPAGGGRSGGPAPAPHLEFHIHAAPGQDEQRIAELVAKEVAKVLGTSSSGSDGSALIDDWDDA